MTDTADHYIRIIQNSSNIVNTSELKKKNGYSTHLHIFEFIVSNDKVFPTKKYLHFSLSYLQKRLNIHVDL